jgi:hypothetical protein
MVIRAIAWLKVPMGAPQAASHRTAHGELPGQLRSLPRQERDRARLGAARIKESSERRSFMRPRN